MARIMLLLLFVSLIVAAAAAPEREKRQLGDGTEGQSRAGVDAGGLLRGLIGRGDGGGLTINLGGLTSGLSPLARGALDLASGVTSGVRNGLGSIASGVANGAGSLFYQVLAVIFGLFGGGRRRNDN